MQHPTKSYPKPTAQVEPYVDVLGVEMAVRFLLRFGGAELNISKRPGPDCLLAQIVGHENALEMGRQYDCGHCRVPLAKPWLSQYLRSQDMSVNEIARTIRASDVSVRKWLADGKGRDIVHARKEDYLK